MINVVKKLAFDDKLHKEEIIDDSAGNQMEILKNNHGIKELEVLQLEILKNNHGIKELEVLQQQVNENNKYLIENKG